MSINAIYVEFDLPYCSLSFGVAPCTATGTKCFNTRNNQVDCGDVANYTASTLTVRFVQNNGLIYWPNDNTPTFKLLESADSIGAKLAPAENMGARAMCTISLSNSKSTMAWIDKNINDREIIASDYFEQGTFLGKFKAINPFIYGSSVRVYRGSGNGQFEIEHYIIDDFSGPSYNSGMRFECVDALKLLNGSKSNWPVPNTGKLAAAIDTVATTFDVEPVGAGAQYPASGRVAIGREGMPFTRSGDTFTVVRNDPVNGLGQVEKHDEGDTVQLIGEFSSERSCDIIYQLIDEGSPIDAPSLINLPEWQNEIDTFQNSLFSATIVKPEPVSKLINELVQQAGLIFWFDVKTNKIKLRVLRPVASPKTFTTDSIIGGLSQSDNQGDRVSEVWTYYNQRDPFKQLTDETNYYSRLISPTAENLYPTDSIRKIFSRWIPLGGEINAIELNARLIERYKNPPRDFSFALKTEKLVSQGDAINVQHRAVEGVYGEELPATCYVTQTVPDGFITKIKAKEFVFSNYEGVGGGANVVIPIEEPFLTNIVLSDLYFSIRSSLAGVSSVSFVVGENVVIGSQNNVDPALRVGDFSGVPVSLYIPSTSYIVGRGGEGVYSGSLINGGLALHADFAISIDNDGTIGGGGGAGGLGRIKIHTVGGLSRIKIDTVGGFKGRCGGAGHPVGLSAASILFNQIPAGATTSAGETTTILNANIAEFFDATISVNNFGNGGNLGQNGATAPLGLGGLAGAAVTGNSNITWVNAGTILGSIT